MKKRVKSTQSVTANEPKNSFVFTIGFTSIAWQRVSPKLVHKPKPS